MLNRNIILILVFAISFTTGLLQNAKAQKAGSRASLEIREVELGDTALKVAIEHFITAEKQNDTSFSKLGYITVTNKKAADNAVLQSYHINKNWVNFDELENDNHFPLYYSYIADKLVLLYYDQVRQTIVYKFSKKTKTKFQKTVEPFLFKSEKVDMVDMDNRPLKPGRYRPGEILPLHGGIDFIRFENGETKVQPGTY